MRRDLRFTLLPEGSSDRALMPILEWVVSQHFPGDIWTPIGNLVRSERLPPGAVATLPNRIKTAVDIYPCDILFIHRDEDGQTIEHRESEIKAALDEAMLDDSVTPLPVIPVRMTEAWLLIDESAIRRAAGFSQGRMDLHLPTPAELERRADPKSILNEAIRVASGKSGRKLARLNIGEHRAMIPGLIEDLSRLRALPSFQHFERSLEAVARQLQ